MKRALLRRRLGPTVTVLTTIATLVLAASPALALTRAENLRDQALAAWKQGDLDTARAKLEEGLRRDPKLPRARLLLAELHLEQGNHASAARESERHLEGDPRNARALAVAYRSRWALGNDRRCSELETTIRQVKGAAHEVAIGLFEDSLASRGDGAPTTIARYEEALRFDPKLMPARRGLLIIHTLRKDHRQVLAAAEGILEHDPLSKKALRSRWEAKKALGHPDVAAARDAYLAVDSGAAAERLHAEAVAQFNSGDMERGARDP